jgi:methyl-accepting chemotaxis protein
MGGFDNEDGVIKVKDSTGKVCVTIDSTGINVNNNFKVSMDGNIEAVSISGGALQQFSDLVDQSDAMSKAQEAIEKAQEAADTANQAARTAQQTADTANKAASDAKSAADSAAKNASDLATDVGNTYDTLKAHEGWIADLQQRVAALGG